MGTSAGSSAQQAMDLLVATPISAACRLGNRHVREAVGHVKMGWVRRGAGGAMWRCCDEAAAVLLCQGTPSSPQPQALAGGLGITPVPGARCAGAAGCPAPLPGPAPCCALGAQFSRGRGTRHGEMEAKRRARELPCHEASVARCCCYPGRGRLLLCREIRL